MEQTSAYQNLFSWSSSLLGIPPMYGNYVLSVLVVILVFLIARIIRGRLQTYLLRQSDNATGTTHTRWLKTLSEMVGGVSVFTLIALSFYIAAQILDLPPGFSRFLDRAILILVLLQLGLWGNRLIAHYLEVWAEARTEQDPSQKALLGLLNYFARLMFWLLLALIALNNMGVDITALVAGVGIGGIAIALAVQNILGDALASLTIALDKPFVVGDSIQVDDLVGTIEQVGLKNTRIRALTGELVIVANNDLLKSRIRNWKKLIERRIVLRIDVVHQTPPDLLRRIPVMVQEVVNSLADARFDYIYLKNLGESSLQYELVYFAQSPDFQVYARIHQELLIQVIERFSAAGIRIPFPTYTVVAQAPKD